MDQAHVQTKMSQSLSESKEISAIVITNPTNDPVLNYRTSIDPALVSSKPIPVDQRVLDLSDEPVPAWLSHYATGLNESEIWHKSSIGPGGVQQVFVGDCPYVADIGASVDLPAQNDDNLSDDWHKNVVTDIASTNVIIAASIQFPVIPFLTGLYQSQMILFPVSARHIVKTPDGAIHAVCSYLISAISRIVYLKSTNGGEKWIATIVDNNDGQHYVLPSITCDRNSGIHITYTRYDQVTFPTFWLYCGGATPDGFELVSNSGGLAYHRLLGGEEGTTYPVLGIDPDTYSPHEHTGTVSGGEVNGSINKLWEGYGGGSAIFGWHHTAHNTDIEPASCLPVSRSLKLLRYWGIPTSIPADIIVPFNSDVPAGYTRYSDQDNYYIYCSDDVGTVVGAAQHRHVLTYNFNGEQYCLLGGTAGGTAVTACIHAHAGSLYTSYAANNPPTQGIILGKVTSPLTVIAQNALLLLGSASLLSSMTSLSAAGESLNGKHFIGKSIYSDLGGSLTHDHDDITTVTVPKTSGGCNSRISLSGYDTAYATCAHTHNYNVFFNPYSSLVSRIMPRAYRVDTQIDCAKYGNDLFYRYISPLGVQASVVNISLVKRYYPSFEGVCLADGSDNLHFLWSAQGLNTTPSKARVSYKKLTSGSLGPRVDLTTSDHHMLYPSMDIDSQGDIHTAWFNASTNQSLEYRKYSGGSWGAVENVDTDSYVGYPGNVITDKDCNVFLFYCKWTDAGTAIKEVFYRKRVKSTGLWSAATNLSPNKAASGYNQFSGQSFIDNKGNIVFIWSGKGYGAHTSVYHPIYRYITPSGTIVPAVGIDAIDLFPDDDTEMFYSNVFWHYYPVTSQVYQNLVVSGFTFLYLYNPRNGALKDTADLMFYSSPDALVGDIGNAGSGGSGDSILNPSGVGAESILQQETYTITTKGHVCLNHLSRDPSLHSIS